MKKLAITLTAITALVMSGSTASANDLIKAFATLQRASHSSHFNYTQRDRYSARGYSYDARGDIYGRAPVRVGTSGSCRNQDFGRSSRSASLEAARLRALERAEHLARLERIAELQRLERRQRGRRTTSTHVNFRIGYQDNLPPLPAPIPQFPTHPSQVPALPIPPNPSPVFVNPAPALPAPHMHAPAFGEVITCEVPLYKRVRVRDRHNIACNARPMVVAVKSPTACGHACSCCAAEVSYVRVMAPPCEPRRIDVSPCGRKIRMDFGKYEIDIVSYANSIKVDYDN